MCLTINGIYGVMDTALAMFRFCYSIYIRFLQCRSTGSVTGAHHSVGQTGSIQIRLAKAPALFQIGVELLEVILRELVQLDMTKGWKNVQSDTPLITVPGAFPNARLAVVVVPELNPVTERHFGVDGIGAQLAFFLHGLLKFLFALSLGPGEDALRDG